MDVNCHVFESGKCDGEGGKEGQIRTRVTFSQGPAVLLWWAGKEEGIMNIYFIYIVKNFKDNED